MRSALLCTVPLLLSACTTDVIHLPQLAQTAPEREWLIVAHDRSWIRTPQARMVMQRRSGPVVEQRLALTNLTSLPGDNFIFLRTVPGSSPGVMHRDRLLAAAGGIPDPFEESDLALLRSRPDGVGDLIWAEWNSGAGTQCVLAMRRLGSRERTLPRGASAIDVLMRNCIRGDSADAALAPLRGENILLPGSIRPGHATSQRPISALAAPLP